MKAWTSKKCTHLTPFSSDPVLTRSWRTSEAANASTPQTITPANASTPHTLAPHTQAPHAPHGSAPHALNAATHSGQSPALHTLSAPRGSSSHAGLLSHTDLSSHAQHSASQAQHSTPPLLHATLHVIDWGRACSNPNSSKNAADQRACNTSSKEAATASSKDAAIRAQDQSGGASSSSLPLVLLRLESTDHITTTSQSCMIHNVSSQQAADSSSASQQLADSSSSVQPVPKAVAARIWVLPIVSHVCSQGDGTSQADPEQRQLVQLSLQVCSCVTRFMHLYTHSAHDQITSDIHMQT